MKLGVVAKVIIMVFLAVVVSVGSLLTIGFYVNRQQIDKAAGDELIGCAYITSGLMTKGEIVSLAQGKPSSELQQKIDWIVDHKPIFKNAAVIKMDGTVLVADKRLAEQGVKPGDKIPMDEEAVLQIETKHPAASKVYEFAGAERKTGYAPIFADHDSSKEIVALMAVDFDASIISDRTWDMLRITLQTGGIFPILAALAAYFFIRRMIRPIERISSRVKAISEGDLQGEPIKTKSKDEIGVLVQAVNRMTENLRDMVTRIQNTGSSVTETTKSLAVDADKSLELVNSMAAAVQQIAAGAQMQETGTKESAQAMEEMAEGVNQIAVSSVTVAEMMNETLSDAEKGSTTLAKVLEQMDIIGSSVEHTTSMAGELQEHSSQIESIISVMGDIAKQTNLLALNASIEASRAGEQGRGFAVVAGEIRKLAEQSRNSSAQIAELIEIIRSSIERMAVSTERETQEVTSGKAVVSELANAFRHIVQQAEQTNRQITDISAISQEISAGTQQVSSSVNEMASIAQRSSAESHRVAMHATGQLGLLEEMAKGAHAINRMNEELAKAASRFKL